MSLSSQNSNRTLYAVIDLIRDVRNVLRRFISGNEQVSSPAPSHCEDVASVSAVANSLPKSLNQSRLSENEVLPVVHFESPIYISSRKFDVERWVESTVPRTPLPSLFESNPLPHPTIPEPQTSTFSLKNKKIQQILFAIALILGIFGGLFAIISICSVTDADGGAGNTSLPVTLTTTLSTSTTTEQQSNR